MICLQSSRVARSNGIVPPTPALLKRKSSLPVSAAVPSIPFCTSSCFVTSMISVRTRSPYAWSCAAAASIFSRLRPAR